MPATLAEASILAPLFREVWPRHTAKHIARAADAPMGTAKAWASGRYEPSGAALLRMIEASDDLANALNARRAERAAQRARTTNTLRMADDALSPARAVLAVAVSGDCASERLSQRGRGLGRAAVAPTAEA
jgi:hypothetical protein